MSHVEERAMCHAMGRRAEWERASFRHKMADQPPPGLQKKTEGKEAQAKTEKQEDKILLVKMPVLVSLVAVRAICQYE